MILGERWAITPDAIRQIPSASSPFRKICNKITEWVYFIENTGFGEMYKINWREQCLAALYLLVKTMGYFCARKIEIENSGGYSNQPNN